MSHVKQCDYWVIQICCNVRIDFHIHANSYYSKQEIAISCHASIKESSSVLLTSLNLLSLALCVGKLPHINIVDFFITRSITSNKFVLSSLNQEIRSPAALTALRAIEPRPRSLRLKINFHSLACTSFNLSVLITLRVLEPAPARHSKNKFFLCSRLLAAFRFPL